MLTRVGIRSDKTLAIGRSEGRGAWIHSDSPECLDRAIGRRAFQRALRSDVDDAEIARLRTLFGERAGQAAGVGG